MVSAGWPAPSGVFWTNKNLSEKEKTHVSFQCDLQPSYVWAAGFLVQRDPELAHIAAGRFVPARVVNAGDFTAYANDGYPRHDG
jgi:hypothetical protein